MSDTSHRKMLKVHQICQPETHPPAYIRLTVLGEVIHEIEAGLAPMSLSRSALAHEWGVLKVSSVSWGAFNPQENKAVPSAADFRPQLEVAAGDLLISRANTPELVGRAVLIDATRPRLMISDKTLRVKAREDMIAPEFVHLALSSSACRRQIVMRASGSSRSMFNISQESLKELILPLPKPEERRQITGAVAAIGERIRAERRTLGSLRAAKAILSDELLSGRTRILALAEV